MSTTSISITGMDTTFANMDQLSAGIRDRALKKAIKAAATPILQAAQWHCPEDTGTLKASLAIKITSKGTKGNKVLAVIGPKRGIRVPVRTATRGKNKGKTLIEIPTRIASLVEFGHANGRGAGTTPPHPFMRPAWDEEGGDVALNVFSDVLALAVVDECAKLKKA